MPRCNSFLYISSPTDDPRSLVSACCRFKVPSGLTIYPLELIDMNGELWLWGSVPELAFDDTYFCSFDFWCKEGERLPGEDCLLPTLLERMGCDGRSTIELDERCRLGTGAGEAGRWSKCAEFERRWPEPVDPFEGTGEILPPSDSWKERA